MISDIVSEGPVPADMQKDKQLWGECISGALPEADFQKAALDAGFYGLRTLKRTLYREVNGFNFWSVTVQAYRHAKRAKCLYMGQFATYHGPFSRISDDEGHTYERGVPQEVCVDSAARLQLPPTCRKTEQPR